LDHSELLEKLKTDIQNFGTILWESLTPFERDRVLKRIHKQLPEIQAKFESEKHSRDATGWTQSDSKTEKPLVAEPKVISTPNLKEPAPPEQEAQTNNLYERSMWNMKTLYQIAHKDMIEQRTTMMKFLLDNYGIEAVEEYFLNQNPQWAETLKVGKLKKIFAKLISKLAPKLTMVKLSDIIIENSQYLVGLDHITISETTDTYRMIRITKCPVKKQFKKTLKTLKFTDLEERYICTFACVPVMAQMCTVGNCDLRAEYLDKENGCNLIVTLKAKEPEMFEQTEAGSLATLKNGPS